MRFVGLVALLLSGCGPSVHVDFAGSDANSDLAAFDDNPALSGDDDGALMFIFDFRDRLNADSSVRIWTHRSFSVNILAAFREREYDASDPDELVVFYGFNPDPDVEEELEWEATEGFLAIRDIDRDADEAEIEMELVMEPSGNDAEGTIRVNVAGTVELSDE